MCLWPIWIKPHWGSQPQVKTLMRIVAQDTRMIRMGKRWEEHSFWIIFDMLWPSICWLCRTRSAISLSVACQLGVFFWLVQAWSCLTLIHVWLHHCIILYYYILLYTLLLFNAQELARPFKIEWRVFLCVACHILFRNLCVKENLLITWVVVLGVLTLNLQLLYIIMSLYIIGCFTLLEFFRRGYQDFWLIDYAFGWKVVRTGWDNSPRFPWRCGCRYKHSRTLESLD